MEKVELKKISIYVLGEARVLYFSMANGRSWSTVAERANDDLKNVPQNETWKLSARFEFTT